MSRAVRRTLATALIAICLGPCGCSDPPPTDTGLVGTWQRIDLPKSTIAISLDDDGYHFKHHYRNPETTVRCERPDECGEYFQGAKFYAYEYRFREIEQPNEILLARKGIPLDEISTPLDEVDRLVVQPGGLELWVYTVERKGRTLPTPTGPYKYRKTSDRPF